MGILDKQMTRKDFIKGTAAVAAGLALFDPAKALAGGMTFSDNVSSDVVISTLAPANTGVLWVDTGSGGVLKYFDGNAWVATKAVWG